MAAEGKKVKLRKAARVAAIAATVALAALAAGGWRLAGRRAAAVRAIPERPDLGQLPAAFAERLSAAEAQTRSWSHPVAGLETLSRLYHANGFYDPALQCYATLEQLEPRQARWPHLEAAIYSQFGRDEDAVPQERRALELAPDYVPAWLRLGDSLLKGDHPADAAKAYEGALAHEAGNPYALRGLARAALAGGDWAGARDRLNEAVRLHPDFVGALELLVTVDEHFGDLQGADSLRAVIGEREFVDLSDPWLDGLMDECYDAYRLSVAATVQGFAKHPAEAKRLLERAIELAPTRSAYHRQLALLLSHEPDNDGARRELERAVELSPTDNDAWLFLYQILNLMGDTGGARRALITGLANCPLSANLHLEYAYLLEREGNPEDAVGELRETFRLNPSESAPLVSLAELLLKLGRADEALAALKEAQAKQPESPMVLVMLTFYYVSLGDEASAQDWWGHIARQPRTPETARSTLRTAFANRFGHPPLP